ncbi:MAG TPA: DNA polymerase III subunit gamma and tau [Micromonosporaceae bacterium]|nr:DNA polymerase III subunit gamma and tau [Micromonosporaceae bacterium]
MALALYRKYRPRTFAEVIGQEHVTEPLSQALRSGRLHHAYLFSGPRGCGKTSSARILARSLNCEQGPTPEPCGTCDSCRSLANDGAGSIDVIEIDAASHGGVDDARELRERAFFAPVSSRYKIYVIDEAHMVSSAGFNALLKLVEEPPDYVKFVFATTEPEKVLGTIRSRTHHYPFRLIPPGVLRPYLEQLTAAEGVKVEPAVFPLVVRAGGGSARDSLSVLDQLIAGAGPEGVTYARAVALLGVTDSGLLDEMCDALAAGDGAAVYATIDRVAEAGHDPRRFAADLLERLRDLIVLERVPDAAGKGLIDGPADQVERMATQAQRLGAATLSRCADIVHNGLIEMRGTTAPRLLLELICARMLLPGAEDSTGALLQRLERMEQRLAGAAPPPAVTGSTVPVAPGGARPAPTPAPTPAAAPSAAAAPAGAATIPVRPEPVPARPVPPEAVMPDPATPEPPRPDAVPGEPDAATVRRRWSDVVALVNRGNKPIAALMRDAVVREVDGDSLVLTVKSRVLAQMVTKGSAVISDALYEELGIRWQIRCEVAGDGASPRSAPGAPLRPGSDAPPRPAPDAPSRPAPSPSAQPTSSLRSGPTGGHGGGGAAGGVPASRSAGGVDWPEPVRPGGATAAPDPAADQQTAVGPTAPRGTAMPATSTATSTAVGAANSVDRNTAVGRSAAAGRGSRTVVGTADAEWAGEPPFDPDYDGSMGGGVTYEGFDPGDEPLDDSVDDQTVRETGEEQALRLLKEALGAEPIDEADL